MSTLKVDYIKNRVGSGAVELSEGATIPTGKNLTVGGNLTVQGTTTTISTTNTVITDKIIELANGTSGTPSGDAGIVVERGSSSNAGVIWDESIDRWKFATGSFTGASTGDLTLANVGITAGTSTFDAVTSTGAVVADTSLTVASDTTLGITAATASLFADTSAQQVQLGTYGALTGGDGSTAQATKCRLAIIASGAGYNAAPYLTLLMGADSGSGNQYGLSDNNTKEARIGFVHYTNNRQPINFLYYQCTANQARIQLGSGTSSCNTPTEFSFAVANNVTTTDSGNICLRLRGEGGGVTTGGDASRLETYGGISEEAISDFSTNFGATPSFDCSKATCFYGVANTNITGVTLTGVDSNNNRVTTIQLYMSCGAARTISGNNAVTVNGGGAISIRWAGFSSNSVTNYTTDGQGITILTLLITKDASAYRVFGFATTGH